MDSAQLDQVLVVGIGYFAGTTGYNVHTDNFFTELAKRLTVIEIDLQDTQRTNKKKCEWIAHQRTERPELQIVNIHINSADNIGEYFKLPGKHIVYCVWESTKFPASWIALFHGVFQIWTPSTWGKQQLINNGVEEKKIAVVPEGVDISVFNTSITPLAALDAYKGFKFLLVGKWEERKGIELAVRAFDALFQAVSDVYLVLLSHNPFIMGFDIDRELERVASHSRNKILSISPLQHQEQVAALYRSCHCAVFPSRAEGWGLPILEAMACGLPVISTGYSAPTDYMTDKNSFAIRYTLSKVNVPLFDDESNDWGEWALPDIEDLKKKMLFCYEHHQASIKRGLQAERDVRAHWTWSKAAEIACRVLGQ